MAEEAKETKNTVVTSTNQQKPDGTGGHVKNVIRMRQQKRRFGGKKPREADEFEQRVVDIRRVTKVNSGSKRLRMSVLVVVGDKKGRVGIAIGRGLDVRDATAKAVKKAKKNVVFVNLKNQTIPHEIVHKYGAAKIFLKPAAPGTGVIAGSAVRSVVELVGIKDILSKSIGTNNKILNVYCTVEALQRLKSVKL